MEYLVVIEVSQKQSYIFKTNRLKENVGASIIIRRITEELPKKFTDKAHFVFAGGGKSVYAFESEEEAQNFTKKFSEHVLVKYSGVELFMATHGYNENTEYISDAIDELYKKLANKKSQRRTSFVLNGLGVSELCFDSQMPASGKYHDDYEKRERLYSDASLVKMRVADQIKSEDEYKQEKYENILIPDDYREKWRFAYEFEELGGSKGVKDYMGVVVIDGNKMGKKIEKFQKDFKTANGDLDRVEYNEKYKRQIRIISEEIDDSFKTSIRNMVEALIDHLNELKNQGITIKEGVLPLRPFILAGDDICFACDARISLKLAQVALKEIEKCDPIVGLKLHASAGIAIVKSHYPFFKAHELAEELCTSAKCLLIEKNDKNHYEQMDDDHDESAIDFHIVQGDIEDSIKTIRNRKYTDMDANSKLYFLTNKPFYLNKGISDEKRKKNNMEFFNQRMKVFRDPRLGRGFVKGYRQALRNGELASENYLRYHNISGEVANEIGTSFIKRGKGTYCTDFDVIEMLDLYKGWED